MTKAAAEPTLASTLRVFVHANDEARQAALERIMVDAGHEVVDALGKADIVIADRQHAGFEMMRESPLAALLTPREMQVLNAIGEGLTNKLIARRLDISLHTVKFHIEALFRKLGVRTRAEAVARARSYRDNAIEL